MPSTISYYDPLYNLIAFKRRFWANVDLATDKFDQIIKTYEVNRLNFLKQEGISWLVFPSASYTRFQSAIGCWFLADFALENVQVSPSSEKRGPWLSAQLEAKKLLEEFRLAALLRNLGTFPFNNTIENNDKLKAWFCQRSETKGIRLRHENFTASLIRGNEKDSIFKLYKEYLEKKIGPAYIGKNLISNTLKNIDSVECDWLTYLIDPDQDMPENASKNKKRLGGLVRHLIRGLIDVGMMDRTSRASFFIYGVGSLVNSRCILQNVLLDLHQEGDARIVLFENGPRNAIDALYEVQNVLTRHVLHNSICMAYEVMLNHAINTIWDSTADKAHHFKTYFPFMDDEEFFRIVSEWDDDRVRKLIQRIRSKDPYICVGRFKVKPFDDKEVLEDSTKKVEQKRRDEIIEKLEKIYPEGQYLIRLSETYGRPQKEEASQSLIAYIGPKSKRDSWLDPYKLFAIHSLEDIRKGRNPIELHRYAPETLITLFAKHMDEQRHTFWLFAPEWTKDNEKIKELEKHMDATYEGNK